MDLRQRLVGEEERYTPGCSEITPMHIVMVRGREGERGGGMRQGSSAGKGIERHVDFTLEGREN